MTSHHFGSSEVEVPTPRIRTESYRAARPRGNPHEYGVYRRLGPTLGCPKKASVRCGTRKAENRVADRGPRERHAMNRGKPQVPPGEGWFGVRTGVWLLVLTLMAVGSLPFWWLRPRDSASPSQVSSGPD